MCQFSCNFKTSFCGTLPIRPIVDSCAIANTISYWLKSPLIRKRFYSNFKAVKNGLLCWCQSLVAVGFNTKSLVYMILVQDLLVGCVYEFECGFFVNYR